MDVITCLIAGLIGKYLFGDRIGKISMFIYAIYPFTFYQTGLLVSETLCTFLTAASILLILKAHSDNLTKNENKRNILFALFLGGVLLGLSSLVRPNTLPLFLPFYVFIILWI